MILKRVLVTGTESRGDSARPEKSDGESIEDRVRGPRCPKASAGFPSLDVRMFVFNEAKDRA
jgi:hypothetical protein